MSQKTQSKKSSNDNNTTKKTKPSQKLGNYEYSLKEVDPKVHADLNLSSMFHLKDYNEKVSVKNDIYYILKHSDIKCSFSIEFIKPISANPTDLEKELEYYSTPTVYYKQQDVNAEIQNKIKPKDDNLSFFELPKSEIIKERFDENIIIKEKKKYNTFDFKQKIQNANDHMPVYIETIERILTTQNTRISLYKLFGFSINDSKIDIIDQIQNQIIPFSIQYEIVNRIPNYTEFTKLISTEFFKINVYYYNETNKKIYYTPLSNEKYDKMIELLKNQNHITFEKLYNLYNDKVKTKIKLKRANFSFKNVTK